MKRILSNGRDKDFVANAVTRLSVQSRALYLAAPYFTYSSPVLEASRLGKPVQLLIGLNAATDPDAVIEVVGTPGVAVRYLTRRFHAKIYVFDDAALLGSANLTASGLQANREAVICLDQDEDRASIEEIRALFAELWEAASVVTPDKARQFAEVWRKVRSPTDPDKQIEDAVGKSEPPNIDVDSTKVSRERIFLEGLRRQVYEEYRPAFLEVSGLLASENLRRADLAELGLPHETNRFLNWVRLEHAPGETAWREAPLRDPALRRAEILRLAREWITTEKTRVPADYFDRLATLKTHTPDDTSLRAASETEITELLLALHAFYEQLRFVKGGESALGPAFWRENGGDRKRVVASLNHLLFGPGDFIQRLHDLLYEPRWRLRMFGLFCALELFGSVRSDLYPPINGRMAKALRYLGFDVKG